MLKETKTEERLNRHKITQEDFTPENLVEGLFAHVPEDVFTDFTKTVLDPACGTGNIINYVLARRLEHTETPEQAIEALSTLHGVELMADNVEENKEIIRRMLVERYPGIDMVAVDQVLDRNIVCGDAFTTLCQSTAQCLSPSHAHEVDTFARKYT